MNIKIKETCLCGGIIFFIFLNISLLRAQSSDNEYIHIKVNNESGKPLPYATINFKDVGLTYSTDNNGNLKLKKSKIGSTPCMILISYVGMQPVKYLLKNINKKSVLNFTLKENNLYLKEVEINAVLKHRQSNTSLLISRNSIDNIQAYSMSEIAQLLPGKAILNSDVHSAGFLTFRSVLSGNIENPLDAYSHKKINDFTRNASFGIAFYIDGTPLSNNTNMQLDSYSKWGQIKVFDRRFNQDNNDNVGSGIDLRSIPSSSIDNIEIISGVAPAKYGDLSTGVVLINRRAGLTPYYGTVKMQNNIFNIALGKGFNLRNNRGLFHFNIDFLKSTKDKRDNLNNYSNINLNMLWTKTFNRELNWDNTIGIDLSQSINGIKSDPDTPLKQKEVKNSGFKLTDRGHLSFDQKFIDKINYNFAFSYSRQYNRNEEFIVNQMRQVIMDAYETGIYESDIAPPRYVSTLEIEGKPISFFANVEASKKLKTNQSFHFLSLGTFVKYEANLGRGKIFNPSTPYWMGNIDGRGDRSYLFKNRIKILQYGAYLQDKLNIHLKDNLFTSTIGLRIENQHGWFGISPRINMSYLLNNGLNFSFAYGINRKIPATAFLYTEDAYFDYVILNHYNDDYKKRLYLYQTKVINTRNKSLKSPYSQNFEAGIRYKKGRSSFSLIGFLKIDKDGITSKTHVDTLNIHPYKVVGHYPSGRPAFEPSGETKTIVASYYMPENLLFSRNQGLELIGNIPNIKPIDISLNFSVVYNYSFYYKKGERVLGEIDMEKEAVVGVYAPLKNNSQEIISTISITKHIPNIGLIFNARVQNFWFRKYHRYNFSIYPVGYYDKNFNIVRLSEEEAKSIKYGYLRLEDNEPLDINQPIIIPNCHLRISKEINKNIRLSCYINNVFNYRPYIERDETKIYFNQSPSVGIDLSYKF